MHKEDALRGIQLCDRRFLMLTWKTQEIPLCLVWPYDVFNAMQMSQGHLDTCDWTDESHLKERNSDMQTLELAMLPVCELLVALATRDLAQYGQRGLQSYVSPPEVTADFRPPSLPYLPGHLFGLSCTKQASE